MPSLKHSPPRGAARVVSVRKDAAAATVKVPKLTAAALGLLESGALQRGMCAKTPALHTPYLSTSPSKRSCTSPTTSAPLFRLFSVDLLPTVDSAADVKESEVKFGSPRDARQLSLSLVTDTNIADECYSLTTVVDGSVSFSPPYTLSHSTCSLQHKSHAHFIARACKCGASCTTQTSICATALHTEGTGNSDIATAVSGATYMSPGHSMSSPGNFLRSQPARLWMTVVPQNSHHIGTNMLGSLEETEEVEEAISVASTMAESGQCRLFWDGAEESTSVIEEDIQCNDDVAA
ncbi:hypothetical protein LPMP_200630 [Leishmania panamensis]|uniref:Uncharacterized protein n=1 Tax=Leishmania panamensis TaxID=5679 RepID=A0A088RNZ9_LEIPA|nr:hypothetical protein LPMP_200630 [Leishmania panamensis]AIN97555.1 hypothetical protein LPMP_200630 [Leishmania panamensis]